MSSLGLRGFTYENGRLILPQWRGRLISGQLIAGPVAFVNFEVLPVSGDVKVNFISLRHTRGAGGNIRVRCFVDGEVYVSTLAMNGNTWYYWFRDRQTDVLDNSVNVTQADGGDSWLGQSFRVDMRNTTVGLTNLEGWVRYEQL